MMKNIGHHNLNLDVKTVGINIPPKVAKLNLVGLFPRRLWLPTKTTWTSRKRKVPVEVEEVKLNKVVLEGVESATKSAFGFGVSAALSLCIFFHAPTALAQSLTVAFPVSRAPEVISLSQFILESHILIMLPIVKRNK